MWPILVEPISDDEQTHLHALINYFYDCERAQARGLKLENVFAKNGATVAFLSPEDVTVLIDDPLPLTDPVAVKMVLEHTVNPDENPLALGFLWVTGSTKIRGKTIRLSAPLLAVSVVGQVEGNTARIALDSEVYLNSSIITRLLTVGSDDEDVAQLNLGSLLDATPDLPFDDSTMNQFLQTLQRMDTPLSEYLDTTFQWSGLSSGILTDLMNISDLQLVPTTALFVGPTTGTGVTVDLEQLIQLDLDNTALEAVFDLPSVLDGLDESSSINAPWPHNIEVLPLTDGQREIRSSARSTPLTVVTGPPGTGKSYTIAALVIDHLLAGRRVLVTSGTEKAVQNVVEKLREIAGPMTVAAGGGRQRMLELAEFLNDVMGPGSPVKTYGEDEIESQASQYQSLRQQIDELEQHLLDVLASEGSLAFNEAAHQGATELRERFGLDDREIDVDKLNSLLAKTDVVGDPNYWKRGRARRALKKARSVASNNSADVPSTDLREIARVVKARQEVAQLTQQLETTIRTREGFEQLTHLRIQLHQRGGLILEMRNHARLASILSDPTKKQALADYRTALRKTKRKDKEALLRKVPPSLPVEAFSCWAVTADHLAFALPLIGGLFDVVVIDEASTVELPPSAPALFRAKRAVIVGDPKQLRFVSMLASSAQQLSFARHSISEVEQIRYRVSGRSLYDIAEEAVPQQSMFELREHFRCAPHIIRFANHEFYGDRLRIMTERPSLDTGEEIQIREVAGRRYGGDQDPNPEEVAEAIAIAKQIVGSWSEGSYPQSIGLLSPFRAQANALTHAVAEAFTPEEISRHALTCGTAHSLQGDERDVVVFSTCLDPNFKTQQLTFLQKQELFNVAITRAKKELFVVTSLNDSLIDNSALFGRFLHHTKNPPKPENRPDNFGSNFEMEVCDALRRRGLVVHTQYPSAGYFIDLVATKEGRSLAIECDGPTHFNPDGTYTDDDIARHLTLVRAGWRIARIPYSEWKSDPINSIERLITGLDIDQASKSHERMPLPPSVRRRVEPTRTQIQQDESLTSTSTKPKAKTQPVKPRIPVDQAKCSCGGNWVMRAGKYGRFYGCSRYPRCKRTRSVGK